MDVKLLATSFVLLCLDIVWSFTQHCTSKLIQCTKMMSKMVARLEDKSSFCQILNNYFNCIETNCNGLLSPCETNSYKNNMLSTWTYCSAYVTPVSLDCLQEKSAATSLWTLTNCHLILLTSFLCFVFIKIHCI